MDEKYKWNTYFFLQEKRRRRSKTVNFIREHFTNVREDEFNWDLQFYSYFHTWRNITHTQHNFFRLLTSTQPATHSSFRLHAQNFSQTLNVYIFQGESLPSLYTQRGDLSGIIQSTTASSSWLFSKSLEPQIIILPSISLALVLCFFPQSCCYVF